MAVTYTPAQLQLSVGETATVSWASESSMMLVLPISDDENVATATPIENHGTYGTFTVTGVGDGTATITINGYQFMDVTVGVVEDESYLNKRGLTHFWENIDQAKLDVSGNAYRTLSIPYGQCDGTSTSTVYTATVPGITELRDGVCMWLKNGVVTSVSGFTININNLGAKPVYNNMAAATRDTTIWNVNYTMLFVYDSTRVEGGCWILYRGYNSDNNTIGYQIRTNSQSLPMTSVMYRYRLLFTSADNEHYVPANNSTSTNATSSRAVCQDRINPFGRIFYYSTTASVAAGSRPSTTALWEQYGIALGYSFNNTGAALTLTSWKPVYLKCAPQADGSAIIDSTTPYVQDLPTTEDGKIYIFLGVAYSATNIELQLDHPVYYYKNGSILVWTGTEVNVQANWNEADSSSDAYIQNKPTIGDATLTVQKNGTTLDTFTANATTNKTINIPVPTKTSDLTNDSGYVVDDGDITCTDTEDGFAQITNPTSHNVAPLSLTHLYGNAEQETTTGKNLAQINDISQINQSVNYYRDISMQHRPAFVAGTTYTFSADVTIGGSETSCTISIGAGSTEYLSEVTSRNNQQSGRVVLTFTPTTAQLANGANFFLRFPRFSSPKTGIDYSIKNAMLEVGSTATAYEPYCGRVPMPNPDFPSDVNVVTGAQTVKITGKNLVEESIDANIDSSGKIVTDNRFCINIAQVVQGRTYTATEGEHFVAGFFTSKPNINSTSYDGQRIVVLNEHTYTFEAPITGYIAFRSLIDYTEAQLELGSQATTYEPYQSQSQEINLGKNLSDPNNANIINAYIRVAGITAEASNRLVYYKVEQNSYYTISATRVPVSGKESVVDNMQVALCSDVPANGVATYDIQQSASLYDTTLHASLTVYTGSHTYLAFKYANTTNTDASATLATIQLERGSKETSFSPYFPPIELAKIGDYADYIWNDGGTWKIHKELGKQTFTGSEAWYLFGNNSGFFLAVSDALAPTSPTTTDTKLVLSDNYTACLFNDIYTSAVDYGVSLYGATNPINRICFRNKDCATANDFKTWLSTHNTTVYYALATPTDTEITDSELVEQLDAMLEAYLYVGENNITLIPSGGAQGGMTLCASLSQLPVATTQRLGAVMVGDGLSVDGSGVLAVKTHMTLTMQYNAGSEYNSMPGWTRGRKMETIKTVSQSRVIRKFSFEYLAYSSVNPVTFLDEASGDVYTPEELYSLLLKGAKVIVNHVPLGCMFSPGSEWGAPYSYVDGVELSKCVAPSPFNVVRFSGSKFVEADFPVGSDTYETVNGQLGFDISGYDDNGEMVWTGVQAQGFMIE